jgi:type I restriction enzyme, S subunit
MKKGWQTKRLSELYKIGSSKRVLQSQWKTEGVPFYRGREVTRLAADGFVDNELFISEEHFAELSKEYGVPKAGDIVITAIGTIGNAHVVRSADRFYFKDASVLWMKRTAEVSSEFVNLWLKSPAFLDQLDRGNGATVDTLTIQKLQSVEIPVPPLAEQKRIVGLLDEAFEGIATAKANAEKNLQNARALFESHLQSVFTQRGPGWVEKRLEDCFRLKSGDGLISSAMKGGKYPVFGGNGIAGMHDEFNLSGDNVIIGRVGALCGNARHINEKIWLTDNAFRIVDRCFEFDGAFLTYLLNFKNLRSLARQAAQPVISNSSLKDLLLPFPEIAKQQKIATQLDALTEETQRLARLYERKLAALEVLKKSLLHQAFTGEL